MPALKGAFLRFEKGLLGLPNIIVFQFNPETVSRTPSLATTDVSANTQRTDVRQVLAAPSESFSFSLRLDATDQLAKGNRIAAASGILPGLSALELLMYPVPAIGALTISIPNSTSAYTNPPNLLPVVLFFWGPFRIMPVNITSMSINELQYDQKLNPIRAEVTVNVQVVSPPALDQTTEVMKGAYKYTQGVKEVMAALNLANSAELISSIALPL